MKFSPGSVTEWVLRLSRLELLPVRVRSGVAEGARWTLFPRSSYWRGTHEPELQAALLALGGGDITGWTCWDLGAHFGLYSVGLARRVGPAGQVAAFEPSPVSCSRLRLHARMNRVPWLKVFQAAVSDRGGSDQLYTYGDAGSTSTHLPYEGETPDKAAMPILVRVVKLDDLVEAGEIRPPQFIKVDVEGHGHHAVAGMLRTLGAHRPIVIAALHSQPESDGIVGPLARLGYSFSRIGPRGATPDPAVGCDYLFTPAC